ncbi:MAG: hypothetical protein R2750_00525 [Bacteroidales bacterium]
MSIQPAIKEKIGKLGITINKPAWEIISNARLLPPIPGSGLLFGDTVQKALLKLMKSYYEYGRQHWSWVQSAGRIVADGG